MPTLASLGWNAEYETEFAPFRERGWIPARVAVEHRHSVLLFTETGEVAGTTPGRLHYEAATHADLPRVGDWVAAEPLPGEPKAVIRRILTRRTKFSRKAAGEWDVEQVIAANIDLVFIMQGLDNDFNPRRMERYLVLAWESGAVPVIILNKADLCSCPEEYAALIEELAPGVPVHPVSVREGVGLEAIREYLKEGVTVAFIGSSGVGKSSLVNTLAEREIFKTREVRADDSRGRHTTSRRELVILPGGGVVIDTPGMRELQMWFAGDGLDEAFADIDEIAGGCRFADCTHTHEARCAVREALESGVLTDERYQSYLKLRKEIEALEIRRDTRALLEKKRQDKILHREIKRVNKINPKAR